MKFKKLTAAAMAAAMLAAAAPICGTASADTQTEYGCEWVDVRPDSKYKLSVEKVNADGKEQCVVTLSGIPINTIESALGEEMVIEAQNMRGTRTFGGVRAVIDINNGSQFIYMGYYEDNNGETKSYAVLDDIRPVREHKDGTPCYTGSYEHGLVYSGMQESSIPYPAEIKKVNDELCFVFTTAVDDISAQYLMNAKTTTVMTYAAMNYSASPINGGVGGASSGAGGSKIGFLSDGTLIKGDGKYIDCGTNQEVQEGFESVRLAAEVVDSITDLPKETVSITVVDDSDASDTPAAPDSTKEQSFHDDTTDISVEGIFPEGTQLKTEIKQVSDTKVSWDITLLDASGNKVQPNGMATVKLPLPESFKGYKVYVYRIEDGKHIRLESSVEGDYIVFKAAHFTEYMLSTEDLDDTSEPATVTPGATEAGSDGDNSGSGDASGDGSGNDQAATGIALAIAPVVLAASAAIVIFKKRK